MSYPARGPEGAQETADVSDLVTLSVFARELVRSPYSVPSGISRAGRRHCSRMQFDYATEAAR
jgi:hypothetical protein